MGLQVALQAQQVSIKALVEWIKKNTEIVMLTGRELLESIELFSETKVIKASGKESVEYVSQGLYPASVEILNGSKALYYQQRGITNPVIIKIREVDFEVVKIVHNGKTIFLDSSIRVNAEEKSVTRGRWRVMTGTFKNER